MERLFGKMPKNEVEEEEYFRESDSEDQFLIQAGPNGWSAVWEDGSSIFEDNKATTNENFKRALHSVKLNVPGEIEVITNDEMPIDETVEESN